MHRAVCVDMPSVSGIQVVSFVGFLLCREIVLCDGRLRSLGLERKDR